MHSVSVGMLRANINSALSDITSMLSTAKDVTKGATIAHIDIMLAIDVDGIRRPPRHRLPRVHAGIADSPARIPARNRQRPSLTGTRRTLAGTGADAGKQCQADAAQAVWPASRDRALPRHHPLAAVTGPKGP